jgi:hypothetical protein
MSDRLSNVEARVCQLERRLDRLESASRVRSSVPENLEDATGPLPSQPLLPWRVPDLSPVVGLIGRTLLVLASAFLLRALTDSDRLDARLGVPLGLVFAVAWIGMADRAGSGHRATSAVFHGLAFIVIALPLLFEATTRFHFLGAEAAAVSLGASFALALAVAWRRHLHILTWLASAGGVVTGVALAIATGELGPFAIVFVVLGVALLWFGYLFEWKLLRWPAALIADVAVLVLSARAVVPDSADGPAIAFAAQALLLVGYLGSFATRTLLLNRDVIPFEVVQSVAAGVVGLGGASALTHATPAHSGELAIGVVTLALSAGCYGAAAVFVARQQSRRRNYYFYTSAAFVFGLVGAALSLPAVAIGPAYAVFGLAASWLGRMSDRVTHRAHAAAYFLAAIVASGGIPYLIYGLGLPLAPGTAAPMVTTSVFLLCGLGLWGLGIRGPSLLRRVPSAIVLFVFVGGVLGTMVSWGLASGSLSHSPDVVATVRTAFLVGGVLLLAFADRAWAFTEGAWLVYPLLGLTGLKLLLEDVPVGRPATLMAGFALYGLALIVAPRLRRRSG